MDRRSDDFDYALVGPTDNRIHEMRTRHFPFSTVCHLGRDFGDGLLRGCSGALIGPRRLLTAAHCLFSLKLRRAPVRIRVAPGRADRDQFPFGTLEASAAYVPRRFIYARTLAERRAHDYGLLLLPRSFPGLERFMVMQAPSDEALARMRAGRGQLTVAGYPADRPIGTLWHHSERLRRYTPQRLLYTVDTCPGHSGSPVWTEHDGKPVIVAVHTSGILDELGRSYGCAKGTVLAPPGTTNSGVRLTRELLANLREPERRVGGQRPMVKVL
jgi:V8-like Glu-specific endopeptidase